MLKEFFNVKNIVRTLGVVFALVAFLMIFVSQMQITVPLGGSDPIYLNYKQVFFGFNISETLFASGTIVPLIGYIFILIGGIIPLFMSLIFKKENKISSVTVSICAVLIMAGAILVFNTKNLFLSANGSGTVSYNIDNISTGPVLAGIFAIVAGFLHLASVFIEDSKRVF